MFHPIHILSTRFTRRAVTVDHVEGSKDSVAESRVWSGAHNMRNQTCLPQRRRNIKALCSLSKLPPRVTQEVSAAMCPKCSIYWCSPAVIKVQGMIVADQKRVDVKSSLPVCLSAPNLTPST